MTVKHRAQSAAPQVDSKPAAKKASNSAFTLVGPKENGYRTASVDAFFTRLADDYELMLTGAQLSKDVNTSRTIRGAVFEAEPGGYLPAEVDRALDRVEDRFSELERRLYIQKYGQTTWNDAIAELRLLLLGRLRRPDGERFRRPSKRLTKGYFVKDVDALCHQLMEHLKGQHQLLPDDIRAVSFTAATGELSYEETQVDAFLDRCIEYLQDTL